MHINNQPLDKTICQDHRTCCGKRYSYKKALLPSSDSSYIRTFCGMVTVQCSILCHFAAPRQHILWTKFVQNHSQFKNVVYHQNCFCTLQCTANELTLPDLTASLITR